MKKKDIKKIVLAYSGGLDTSIIIPWLKENYNDPEIIAVSGDVGQDDELEGLEEKAIKTGASKLYIADLTDEMVDDVIIPSLKMGASYEQYLLGTIDTYQENAGFGLSTFAQQSFTAGDYTLTFVLEDKNASSGGSDVTVSALRLVQPGERTLTLNTVPVKGILGYDVRTNVEAFINGSPANAAYAESMISS